MYEGVNSSAVRLSEGLNSTFAVSNEPSSYVALTGTVVSWSTGFSKETTPVSGSILAPDGAFSPSSKVTLPGFLPRSQVSRLGEKLEHLTPYLQVPGSHT